MWLMTQFNTVLSDDQELQQNFDIHQLINWRDSPEYQQRLKIAALGIPKTRLQELRAEILELKMLKKDFNDVDYKNVPLSEYRCESRDKIMQVKEPLIDFKSESIDLMHSVD